MKKRTFAQRLSICVLIFALVFSGLYSSFSISVNANEGEVVESTEEKNKDSDLIDKNKEEQIDDASDAEKQETSGDENGGGEWK